MRHSTSAPGSFSDPRMGGSHDHGGHFYFLAPQPVKSSSQGSIDILGHGSYVLAPPSTHPDGGKYEFTCRPERIFRLTSLNQLPWLELKPAKPRRLNTLAKQLIDGDQAVVKSYGSRSEAEAALCASLCQTGHSKNDALRLLLQHPGPGKFQELHADNQANAIRYFEIAWNEAVEFAIRNPRPDLSHIREWAEQADWSSRSGNYDRAVFLAHVAISERSGRVEYGATSRQLAELAGVTWQTASKATKRLEERQLVVRLRSEDACGGGVFKLGVVQNPDNPLDTNTVRGCQCIGKEDAGSASFVEAYPIHHDAFRYAGLNKTGHSILQALWGCDMLSVAQLASLAQVCRSTAYSKLSQMQDLGMVDEVRKGHWRILPIPDLNHVAEILGAAGSAQRQLDKHRRDRDSYARHRSALLRNMESRSARGGEALAGDADG